LGVVALVVLCAAGRAHADDSDELIRQGVECRRKRDDACGLRFFRQAYDKAHTPRALAQMGLAEQALGKWVAASEHLREALAVRGDPWIEKNRAVLTDSAGHVADHVGFVEIFGGSSGAEVRVDGAARGTLPLARSLATTTGTVAIDLAMAGRLPIRRTTTVRAGETTREAFDELPVDSSGGVAGGSHDDKAIARRVEPVADKPPASQGSGAEGQGAPADSGRPTGSQPGTADRATHASSLRWPLVIGTSVAALGTLIFATVEYSKWSGNVDSYNVMKCADKGGDPCNMYLNDGRHQKTLMYVGYGAAGALAVTSVVLFFALDESAAANHQVACLPTPGSGGVSCAFRF
jgi:hypothetical protein